MTARLKPAAFSKGEPVETSRRDMAEPLKLSTQDATQCRVLTLKSSRARRQFAPASRSRLALRHCPSRGHDHPGRAVKRARTQFESEQALRLERAGQPQRAGFDGREAEAAVIGRIAQQQHRAMAARLRNG